VREHTWFELKRFVVERERDLMRTWANFRKDVLEPCTLGQFPQERWFVSREMADRADHMRPCAKNFAEILTKHYLSKTPSGGK
jgi:hypothetical protein